MSLERWSWVIRIGFFNVIKRVRVLLIKYIKYQTVYLKKPDYERAKGTPQFLAALQLGRIVNSINSCQRTYLRVIDKGKLTQTKDQMEQLFTLASYVYEGVKEFFRREKDLTHLRAWRDHKADIRFLKKEKDQGRAYWVMLNNIRNQVMFHFLPQAIETTIETMVVGEEIKFAVGRTAKIEDTVYMFGDDILLKYIFDRRGIDGVTIDEKITGLMNYVLLLSNTLRGIINSLLLEMLKSFRANLKRTALE